MSTSVQAPAVPRAPALPDALSGVWRRWWPATLVLALTVVAVVVRWWDLSRYDTMLWGDEATLMSEARRFLTGEYGSPWCNDTLGNPALFDYLMAQLFRLTGVTVWAARAYTGLWGALGVPLLYLLARELGLRRSTAAAAALLLATMSWHVQLSRVVVVNINGATMVEAVLLCVVAALRRNSVPWAMLSGVALAVALNGYIGTRVLFPILGLWLLILIVANRRRATGAVAAGREVTASSATPVEMTSRRYWVSLRRVLLLGVVALVVTELLLIPLIRYYEAHPDDFSSHTMSVMAFSSGAMQRLFGLHPELPHNVWGVAWYQFSKTIGMFIMQGPIDAWSNQPGRPLLDPLSNVFLIVGLALCLWRWRSPLASLLLCWLGCVYVFGAFLAIDPPEAHKAIPAAPALCLLIALGIEAAVAGLARLWSQVSTSRHSANRSDHAVTAPPRRDTHGSLSARLPQGMLWAVVAIIALVNVQRQVSYVSSPFYQQAMTHAATLWGRYLGGLGTVNVAVVSPLGYPGEFPRLFAPQATLCNAEWTGQWQTCPPARVVIFDQGADADAARYAALTHRVARPGPAPFGQRLYWYVTSPTSAPLPDPAVTLGHT